MFPAATCNRWPCVSLSAVHRRQTSRRLLNCEISCAVFLRRADVRCIWLPRVPSRAPAFRTSLRPLGVPIRLCSAGCNGGRAGACRRIPSRIASHSASQHVPNPMCVVPMHAAWAVVSDATQLTPGSGYFGIGHLARRNVSHHIQAPAGQGPVLGLTTSWFRHRRCTSVSGRMGQVGCNGWLKCGEGPSRSCGFRRGCSAFGEIPCPARLCGIRRPHGPKRESHEPFKRSIAKTPKSCGFRPVMSMSQKLSSRPHGSLDLGLVRTGRGQLCGRYQSKSGQHDISDCPGPGDSQLREISHCCTLRCRVS
ncbi:hypothetical protein B0T18DRAFT_209166 [Schizothecium vesticola]|uniref:Uncharacterized protein n=1 Tax=Schizothecium vesticola TaxID=314040 RepID=A0AA40JZF4_9PEZI|nr:hypothetical protein B0T18DRAFT_209166 [Schizothecium vesticola]